MTSLDGTAVTIIGVHYAPETTGNAPYTTALAQSLAAAGVHVRVITGVPHYPQWRILDSKYKWGLRWRERLGGVDITRVRHFVPVKAKLLGRAGLELTFLFQSAIAAAKDRSDVLVAVTPTLSGLAAALLCRRGRPVGVLVQDLIGAAAIESGTSSGRIGRLIARVEYWLLRQSSEVGIITPRFGQVLVANGIQKERLIDLPNFTHVTPVAATPSEARKRLGWLDEFTVVHTGNLGMKQGLEPVVQAARIVEAEGGATQFVLVGDGNQRRALEDLSAGCANLRFIDPKSAEEYPYALAAADVLLVCERSGVLEISLPSKLTSYTVAGRPIIAAVEADGITADALARYGAALICRSGDASELLAGIRRIEGSPALAASLVERADTMYREQYSAANAHERYREFIRSLTNNSITSKTRERV